MPRLVNGRGPFHQDAAGTPPERDASASRGFATIYHYTTRVYRSIDLIYLNHLLASPLASRLRRRFVSFRAAAAR